MANYVSPVFHLPFRGNFKTVTWFCERRCVQDGGCRKVWRRDSQMFFFVITHHWSMYANDIWKGDYFFLCFGLYPRTWGPTCQLPWFGSPWFDEKIIRSCTWALAWTPFILGYLDRQLGTCQRSAGSLGIRLSGAQIFHNFSFSQV